MVCYIWVFIFYHFNLYFNRYHQSRQVVRKASFSSSCYLELVDVDSNIQIILEMIRDEQLGIVSGCYFKCMIDYNCFFTEKIYEWLSPPNESVNYNAAHAILESQPDTCQWFLKGNTFYGWLKQPGFLWIKGKCEFSVNICIFICD
jgi:hypothetical protein